MLKIATTTVKHQRMTAATVLLMCESNLMHRKPSHEVSTEHLVGFKMQTCELLKLQCGNKIFFLQGSECFLSMHLYNQIVRYSSISPTVGKCELLLQKEEHR